jgi:hypothetical protein
MILLTLEDFPFLKLVMSRSRVRIPSSAFLLSISYSAVKTNEMAYAAYMYLLRLQTNYPGFTP